MGFAVESAEVGICSEAGCRVRVNELVAGLPCSEDVNWPLRQPLLVAPADRIVAFLGSEATQRNKLPELVGSSRCCLELLGGAVGAG